MTKSEQETTNKANPSLSKRLPNEVGEVFSQHLAQDGSLPFEIWGPRTELTNKIMTLLRNPVQPYERPDAYIHYDNMIMFIEHFQFDCSCNLNGSPFKKKGRSVQGDIKYFERKAQVVHADGEELYCDQLPSSMSLSAYQEALMRSFKRHCENIPAYIVNTRKALSLSSTDRLLKFFLIEDASPLPCLVYDGNKQRSILPIMVKEFFDALIASDLDGIIMALRAYRGSPLYYWEKGFPVPDDFIQSHEKMISFQPYMLSYNRMGKINEDKSNT